MTRTAERETFYADIVCTAAEGGIAGWGYAENRKMYNELVPDGGLSPQRHGGDNYIFTLVEIGDGDLENRYTVTPAVVTRGYSILRDPKNADKVGLHPHYRSEILTAWHEKDAGIIDAFYAGWLVQIGLFGEVIYS